MLDYFTVDCIKAHLDACEKQGVNTLVARADRFIMRVLAEYWREGGRNPVDRADRAGDEGPESHNIRQAKSAALARSSFTAATWAC